MPVWNDIIYYYAACWIVANKFTLRRVSGAKVKHLKSQIYTTMSLIIYRSQFTATCQTSDLTGEGVDGCRHFCARTPNPMWKRMESRLDHNMLEPIFFDGPTTADMLEDLICGCRGRQKCLPTCSCVRNNMGCTELCLWWRQLSKYEKQRPGRWRWQYRSVNVVMYVLLYWYNNNVSSLQ